MKKIVLLNAISFCFLFAKLYAQVGIGTATPNVASLLHVDVGISTTKGLLVTGTYNASATVPNLGAGSRLMFYPGKAAFRAGFGEGTRWDDANVGLYSVATGDYTIASGDYSTALGFGSTASGTGSTAMGGGVASGDLSTAIGSYVNTGNQTGAFSFGDDDPNGEGVTFSAAPNQFVARFWNGYYLLTSGDRTRSGVQIAHNGNSWVTICDKKRKENFEPLNGEDVLQKLSAIKFTSWNYKMQDPKIYRHYGIMAQDFNNAFGHDKYGAIGDDTTVNPIDMIGIDMAAIQALEKRTSQLKNEDAILNNKLSEITELKKENENLKLSVAQLQTSFIQQQKQIVQSLKQLEALTIKRTGKETVVVK